MWYNQQCRVVLPAAGCGFEKERTFLREKGNGKEEKAATCLSVKRRRHEAGTAGATTAFMQQSMSMTRRTT